MSKAGRHPITELIPPEKIARAYERTGSARKAAILLQTTHKTVIKVLRNMGYEINPPRAWVYTEKRRPRKHSKFADWLRENQSTDLPRSLKKLSEMSGVSYAAVNNYMFRRREALRERLSELPDLIDSGVVLEASNIIHESGKPVAVNSRAFYNYEYVVDHYDLSVTIQAESREHPDIRFDVPDLGLFSDRLNKLQMGHSG